MMKSILEEYEDFLMYVRCIHLDGISVKKQKHLILGLSYENSLISFQFNFNETELS